VGHDVEITRVSGAADDEASEEPINWLPLNVAPRKRKRAAERPSGTVPSPKAVNQPCRAVHQLTELRVPRRANSLREKNAKAPAGCCRQAQSAPSGAPPVRIAIPPFFTEAFPFTIPDEPLVLAVGIRTAEQDATPQRFGYFQSLRQWFRGWIILENLTWALYAQANTVRSVTPQL
jgi:hypothetical protein